MELRELFKSEILNSIECSREIGYNPSAFVGMIEIDHPVEVAKKLMVSGRIQPGFERLIKANRKDLTVEYIMLKPEYNDLFGKQHLEAAEWRLKQAN